MTIRLRGLLAACALALAALCGRPASAADTIKFAYVDPLSGPFASAGDEYLKVYQTLFARMNAEGGIMGKKIEIVPFDDKLQPAEALIALKSITDQNIPFVMHCVGSNVGAAMIDGVSKHNARNPDNRIIYLNCGALATELTNEQCDFWHFRFSGSVDMRTAAMVKSLPKDLKTVYVLNQDYLFGQSVRDGIKKWLAKLRPDIKVLADELMPFGKVQDFAPYVEKIKASGAQSVLTGNYNRDLNLLVKAAVDAGLTARFDTILAHQVGAARSIGAAGEGRLTSIIEFSANVPPDMFKGAEAEAAEKFASDWTKAHESEFSEINYWTMLKMVKAAIEKVGSTDALKVALALEDMHATDMVGQDNVMRKDDHQLLMPYYTAVFTKNAKHDSENTGLGWKTISESTAQDLALPTVCKMKRPQK
jgi:branched-chain amino acid transport system substrate-binding protein